MVISRPQPMQRRAAVAVPETSALISTDNGWWKQFGYSVGHRWSALRGLRDIDELRMELPQSAPRTSGQAAFFTT